MFYMDDKLLNGPEKTGQKPKENTLEYLITVHLYKESFPSLKSIQIDTKTVKNQFNNIILSFYANHMKWS